MVEASFADRIINLAVEIQQIPSKTFQESRRAAFIHRRFLELGLKEAFIDETGNVYAPIKGRGMKKPLVITAHMDTVFPDSTDLSIKRQDEKIFGAGIGDNSLGLAGLFGLYIALSEMYGGQELEKTLPGDIWLVANVAEEGLGNLKGIKAVADRFGKAILAYIILEGMALGQIYHRGLGVRRYRISVHTKGGHSWIDYGTPSAIHELAELIVKIKHLPMPVEPRTSFNVGVISGGTSVNTIAAEASLELDLRSVSPQALASLASQVEDAVAIADRKGGELAHVQAEVIGNRPAGEISADHPLVKLAKDCYTRHGIKPRLNIGSTDTNEPLSRGLPAICIGLTTGGCAHTLREYIDTKPVAQGLDVLVDIVQKVFERDF